MLPNPVAVPLPNHGKAFPRPHQHRRLMTKEEIDRYHYEAAQSDGFDVGDYCWALNSNVIRAMPPGTKDDLAEFCANFAVEERNKENKANGVDQELHLLGIAKFNIKAAAPRLYYLTLNVVDKAAKSTGEPLVYQAEVSLTFPKHKSEVLVMRPKPENPEIKLPWGYGRVRDASSCTSKDDDSDSDDSSSGEDDSDLLACGGHHVKPEARVDKEKQALDLDEEQGLMQKVRSWLWIIRIAWLNLKTERTDTRTN